MHHDSSHQEFQNDVHYICSLFPPIPWCRPEKCCQLTTCFLVPLDSILSNQNTPPYGGFFYIDCLQSNLEVHSVGLFLEILEILVTAAFFFAIFRILFC